MDENKLTNGNRAPRQPIVIAGCSGGMVDRERGLRDLAKIPEIDVITGDWMSEGDMAINGPKIAALKKNMKDPAELGKVRDGYQANFLWKVEPTLKDLAQNHTKLVCNAGGSNPHGLAEALKELIADKKLDLKVAWIEGDDVTGPVLDLIERKENLENINSGEKLSNWKLQPASAQCYLGAIGISKALEHADIVIAGRVADSSPCIGACMWWHGWGREDFQQLASALICGHLTECSTYSTGGCFAEFKKWNGKAVDLGFPIAHIEHTGEFEITMETGKDGEVSIGTLTSQLIYEIQGPLYYNSTVVGGIENIKLQQVGPNRVRVTGVEGFPPPPTTKVGLSAPAGYRAEYHIYLTGLDLEEKVEMTKNQILHSIGDNLSRFSRLTFQQCGIPDTKARTQDAATIDLRIFAQSADPDVLTPDNFLRWCKMHVLQCCPGLTPNTDPRAGTGRLYYEYWPTIIPQSVVQEKVHLPNGSVIEIDAPSNTKTYPKLQRSYETANPLSLGTWGPTALAPMGYIVLGRSGDKASDANVGFFVRHDDEWDWLRSTLTVDKIRELLANDDAGKPIDRFEMSNIKAVHFLLRDHLEGGYNSGPSLDCCGKNLVEYLRAKEVDIPTKFLERPRF